jgi:hypothetical protein
MTFTLSGLSSPATTGNDYPTGTCTITITVDNVAVADSIVLTFNGTATGSFKYGSRDPVTFTLTASSATTSV